MKTKMLLIAVLLLSAGSIFAQQGDGGQWNICRLDSIYNYMWDTTAQDWIPKSKILRTYDDDHYLTNANVQMWNGFEYGNVSQKDTFSYDTNGNFINDITQIWNGTDWLMYQAIYGYNTNNQRISMLYQRLNGSVWEDLQQSSYTYDGNGYLETQVTQTWIASQWQNSVRYTYTNNTNGNPTNLLVETWSNSQWVNYRQYTYSYDVNGYNVSQTIESWDGAQFVSEYVYTFTNNNNGFHEESIMQQWSGTSWNNYSKQVNYHYCTNALGIENHLLQKSLSVYPNPFIDKLTIEPNISYLLFDLFGREVDKNNLLTLPVGTYILKTKFGVTRVIKE